MCLRFKQLTHHLALLEADQRLLGTESVESFVIGDSNVWSPSVATTCSAMSRQGTARLMCDEVSFFRTLATCHIALMTTPMARGMIHETKEHASPW